MQLSLILAKLLIKRRERARNEEDVLSYIAFPQQSEQFFARREQTFTASYSFKEVK